MFSDYSFSFLYRIESGIDPISRAKILYIGYGEMNDKTIQGVTAPSYYDPGGFCLPGSADRAPRAQPVAPYFTPQWGDIPAKH